MGASTSSEAIAHLAFIFGQTDPDGALARRLLSEFGSVTAALQATDLRRTRVLGSEAAERLTAFGAAMRLTLGEQLRRGPVVSDWQAVVDYLGADLSARPAERVRVLFLDARNRLIVDELLSEGTINEAAVHTREVVRRALEVGAAALILAHNHPSGNITPSAADTRITRSIVDAGLPFDLVLHDHLIFGSYGPPYSMRLAGLL